jgi:hypothetical protein
MEDYFTSNIINIIVGEKIIYIDFRNNKTTQNIKLGDIFSCICCDQPTVAENLFP